MVRETLEEVGGTTLLGRRVDEDKTGGTEGAWRHLAGAHGRPARQEEGADTAPEGEVNHPASRNERSFRKRSEAPQKGEQGLPGSLS